MSILTKKPLKVLNASAGSGKTRSLVKAYIKLLLHEDASPSAFASVIAMTFTNKAALEMKERIILALDKMSSPHHYPNNKEVMITELAEELRLTETAIQQKCQLILASILHRYEEFHVMTIDKFNLKLIKSFSRDLDLPNDFEVILDETELIEKIVDDLLNQLGKEESKKLNDLILYYARTNIEEGDKWNFRSSLVEFGSILRNERNHAIVEQLLTMNFSLEQYRSLRKVRNEMDLAFVKRCEAIRAVIDTEGITEEKLPGKSRTMSPLLKLIGATSFDSSATLATPTFHKNLDIELKDGQYFPETLKQPIRALIDYHARHVNEYAPLELFMKNFFNMALLQYMAGALKNARKEHQLIRISEFNSLISELIQHESTPFIYERMGTKFRHFLLDEFQDTSRLQFLNMVPLIKESISQNYDNLIVGDPKQSIYRFKNGVAEQFVELPGIYNPENDPAIQTQSTYFEQMGEVDQLEDNWRSSPSIVALNNAFFTEMKNHLPEATRDFYNAVVQHPKSTRNGRIRMISKEEKRSAGDLVPQIVEWVEECVAAGFDLGEICILGNTNRDCSQWAIGLNDHGYNVVSADSLLINTSLKVQLTIAYLHRRLYPSGENEKRRFAELYFRIHAGTYTDYQRYILEKETAKGKKFRTFDDAAFLRDHFEGYNSFFFKHESIYDLIQGFFQRVGYNELADPYLHHLADIAFDYGLRRGPDLKEFLADYAVKKGKIAVQIPESREAIQLMTIHKSKGLQFPAVIIPSMNFNAKIQSRFLIPVDDYVIYKQPSKNDQLEVLSALYNNEHDQLFADNVNKCYVAMTRPIDRLYVGNYFEKSKFGSTFHEIMEASEWSKLVDDTLIIDLDDGPRTPRKTANDEGTNFHPINVTEHLWFPDIALQDTAELQSSDYLSPEMQFGNEFHLLLSTIERKTDIEEEMDRSIQAGEVSASNRGELQTKLNDLFANPAYTSLFEGAVKVLSEQAIIQDANTVVRPDKVILKDSETIILDYKTGIPKDKDIQQIKSYQSVLTAMGYPTVSCYLFYSSLGELRLVS